MRKPKVLRKAILKTSDRYVAIEERKAKSNPYFDKHVWYSYPFANPDMPYLCSILSSAKDIEEFCSMGKYSIHAMLGA